MTEGHLYEDDAMRYVLGILGPKERREFEARMANSSELRSLVRALEAGSVALAMAVPRREPPPRVWEGIQNAINREDQRRTVVPVYGVGWLWSGWAAAACVLIGWFIYAFWFSHAPPSAAPTPMADGAATGVELQPGNPSAIDATSQLPQPPLATNRLRPPAIQRSAAQASESAALRRRIAEMEAQLAQLSQTITQHQVVPPDLNRLTFFQFTPATDKVTGRSPTPSPELQRALLLALARELGWLPPPETRQKTGEQKAEDDNAQPQNAQSGVEFVDLAPADSDASPRRVVYPSTEESASTQPKTTGVTEGAVADNSSTTGAVPGFLSGTNLVFAVNSSVIPSGTDFVTVWSSTGNGQALPRGSFSVGQGPTVVTVPFGNSFGAPQFTITAGPGGSTIIGQFPPPGNPP